MQKMECRIYVYHVKSIFNFDAFKSGEIVLFISPEQLLKFKHCYSSGTRRNGKGVLRSNGCTLCRIRRTVRLRSCTLGARTAREGLSQRIRQPSRVPQVFLSENASAFVHLRKRDSPRSVAHSRLYVYSPRILKKFSKYFILSCFATLSLIKSHVIHLLYE